jgi:hypothetical protein
MIVSPVAAEDSESEDSEPDVHLETAYSLQYKVGTEYRDFLPTLEQLSFFLQDDESYHPISLYIGACSDPKTNTVRAMYLVLKRHANYKVSPPLFIVMAQAITDANIKHEMFSVVDPARILVPEALCKMVKEKSAILLWPSRSLTEPYKSLRAVAKYCFILAAEAELLRFTKHHMPQGKSFPEDLQAACKKIKEVMNQSSESHDYSEEVKKLSDQLQAPITDVSPRLKKKLDRVATTPTRPERQSRASIPTIPKRNEVKRNQGPATRAAVMSGPSPRRAPNKELATKFKAQHRTLEMEAEAVRELIVREQEREKEIKREMKKVFDQMLKHVENPEQYRR